MLNYCVNVMVTSFKGGVGKSTITANLGMTLAKRGKRVLALDCDFNMRCLDLILGLESHIIYDICDVCRGTVPFSKAVITDPRSDNFFFCPAPYANGEMVSAHRFREVLEQAADEYQLDYILIDTPGDMSSVLDSVADACDKALIVATHQPTSIRAAEKTSSILSDKGIADRRLIINNFDAAAVRRKARPGIIDIIDRTYVQLIGVIPASNELAELQESGSLVDTIPNSDVKAAFDNMAKRLEGQSVPLFENFGGRYNSVKLK